MDRERLISILNGMIKHAPSTLKELMRQIKVEQEEMVPENPVVVMICEDGYHTSQFGFLNGLIVELGLGERIYAVWSDDHKELLRFE